MARKNIYMVSIIDSNRVGIIWFYQRAQVMAEFFTLHKYRRSGVGKQDFIKAH